MSHGLLLWLENIDRRRNEIIPIDHTQDIDTLQEHHKTLLVKHVSYVLCTTLKHHVTQSNTLILRNVVLSYSSFVHPTENPL